MSFCNKSVLLRSVLKDQQINVMKLHNIIQLPLRRSINFVIELVIMV